MNIQTFFTINIYFTNLPQYLTLLKVNKLNLELMQLKLQFFQD